MTTEAFDPFANDEDIDDDNVFQLNTTMKISNRRSNPTRHTSQLTQTSHSIDGNGADHITDKVMKEFNYAFPSLSLNGNDDDDGDEYAFGFTSHFFPKENTTTAAAAAAATTAVVNTNNITSTAATTTPPTFAIAEEMSVIHKSSTNQCSVTVRGVISVSRVQPICFFPLCLNIHIFVPVTKLEGGTTSNYSGDISVRDPHRQLVNGIAISNNNKGTNRNNVATRRDASDPNSFRLNYTSDNNKKNNSVEEDCPILEYTCGESVRPVPMVSGCFSFREAVNYHRSNK